MKVSLGTTITLLAAVTCVSSALVAVSTASEPADLPVPARVEVLADPVAVVAGPVDAERAGPPGPRGSIDVRFVQYNIHYGASGIDRVADDIARTGADVVMLNEVDVHDTPGGIHQARYLARRLGMNVVYDANIRFPWGRRGNAVLTTYDVVDLRRYDLYVPPGSRPRGLMRVRLASRGMRFDVWASHLNPALGTLRQARDVSARIGAPTCATVFGGDLNAKAGKPEHMAMRTYLNDVWRAVGEGPGNTNYHHDKRIDYLYYDRARPLDAWVTPLRHSDHRAVVGVLRLDRAQGCQGSLVRS